MKRTDQRYREYVEILNRELVPAMGCTEPITIAYAAAKARETLGALPQRVKVEASGNIIKNVKSVVVPNTNHLKGIEAAAAAGIIAGDAGRVLEVLSAVSEAQKAAIADYLAQNVIEVCRAQSDYVFDIAVTVWAGADEARVRIAHYHTNIVLIEKNGEKLMDQMLDCYREPEQEKADQPEDCLNIEEIIDFANSLAVEDVKPVLQRQAQYNMAIAEEGLRGNYGANIGRVLLKTYGERVSNRAKAKAAAASDARMSGCELPVVINSGSGNQGITASVPVIEYAREMGVGEDKMYRALALSNLVAIHQKRCIGTLSAYCGAVSAGGAAGAGIAYLHGGGLKEIAHTLVNCLAITSGIVCDGAKSSCAAKIAVAIDAAILGYAMYEDGQQFRAGEGIIKKGVEATISSVGRLGKVGMRETDNEIIRIMINAEEEG
ncbi:Serine dehydratase alpha chain [uncultured Clostridium sp.]|nr:Serine dehydratase alpha chain [uncultured Clostridium sp.]